MIASGGECSLLAFEALIWAFDCSAGLSYDGLVSSYQAPEADQGRKSSRTRAHNLLKGVANNVMDQLSVRGCQAYIVQSKVAYPSRICGPAR